MKADATIPSVVSAYITWSKSCYVQNLIQNWNARIIWQMITTSFTNDLYLASPQSSLSYCPSGIVKLYRQECT